MSPSIRSLPCPATYKLIETNPYKTFVINIKTLLHTPKLIIICYIYIGTWQSQVLHVTRALRKHYNILRISWHTYDSNETKFYKLNCNLLEDSNTWSFQKNLQLARCCQNLLVFSMLLPFFLFYIKYMNSKEHLNIVNAYLTLSIIYLSIFMTILSFISISLGLDEIWSVYKTFSFSFRRFCALSSFTRCSATKSWHAISTYLSFDWFCG